MHLYRETPHHQGPTLFVDMNVPNRTAIEVKVEVSSHIHTFVTCDETSQGHAISRLVDMPYSAKFSRHISFAVFADWSQTAKIKLANFSILSSGQRLSLDSELYHHAAKTWSTHSISSLAHDRQSHHYHGEEILAVPRLSLTQR